MKGDLLEFDSVKGYIRNHIVSDVGISALDTLCPFKSWDMAEARLSLTAEMIHLIKSGSFSINAIPDIRPLLNMKEGTIIEGQDILKVSSCIKEFSRLKNLIRPAKGLSSYSERIVPMDELVREIEMNIMPSGEVSDLRNPLLRQLRTRFRGLRASVLERLEGMLTKLRHAVTEEIITTRNNRFVIPMRHDFGIYIQGITHDYSGSRHSVYVEPIDIVEDNNMLAELKSEIREEEEKVLRHLTTYIIRESDSMRKNLETYAELDMLNAVSRWAIRTDSTIPAIGEEIDLKNARHPVLLERLGRECVPLDLRLGRDRDCLIITGPNAGGKTVALKTLGLLILMAKSGLPIPADKESALPETGRIWVEMDTSQDITHDLSTFTAHAKSLKEIYENVFAGDMVLLDEPGTGTDHDHGSAIAVAAIDAFRQKGATVIVTSHSETVKLYGMSQGNAEIAAMTFDEKTIKPLYTIQYGVIGSSRAFEILKSIGFPERLIEDAEGILSGNGDNVLTKAIEDIGKAGELRYEAEKALSEATDALKAAQDEHRLKIRERFESALRYKKFMEKLERLADRPSRKGIKAVKELPEASILEDAIRELPEHAGEMFGLSIGMEVRIKTSQVAGIISGLTSETAEIACGTKRITVSIDQIEPVEKGIIKEAKSQYARSYATVVLPIVVVGMRVDEAMPIVERALDQAILSGQETLEIIHGSGSGTLRKMIRENLKESSHVRGLEDAAQDDGGGTKTIVRLG